MNSKQNFNKKKKVVCALSGGIDSGVSAALLKESGDLDVTTVFMRLGTGRTVKESEKRARRIAEILEISFKTVDLEEEFNKIVVDSFIKDYKKGITPNPCITCNREIKFKLLFQKVKGKNGGFLSTGHYARLDTRKGKIRLLKAKDENKDQSYFLWRLNQKLLKNVMFPVGGYKKTEVRKMAVKFGLPIAEIPESQEVCFIERKTEDFLKSHLKTNPGRIIDKKGKILGKHQGLWFYTIGQRRGIRLAGGPFYVADKRIKKNILVVTRDERDLYRKEAFIRKVSWISGKAPVLPVAMKAKIRYKHKAVPTLLSLKGGRYHLAFERSQRAVTPGQSAVFYKGMEVLGGGEIS